MKYVDCHSLVKKCVVFYTNKWFTYGPDDGRSKHFWNIGFVAVHGDGVIPCLWTAVYCRSPRWCMSVESQGAMILTGENRRTRRETCPSATLSTANPLELTRIRTRSSAVRGRLLTVMVRSSSYSSPWEPQISQPSSSCSNAHSCTLSWAVWYQSTLSPLISDPF
jgi:hypothetical protein